MQRNFENLYAGYFDSHTKKQYSTRTEERLVDSYELELFTEESGTSHINGEAYPVRRGMLLSAKPGQIRWSNLPVRCNFLRIKPGEPEIDALLDAMPNVIYIEDASSYEKLLTEMRKLASAMLSGSDSYNLLKINSLFYGIIRMCLREGGDRSIAAKTDNRIISEVCCYIDENFTRNCSLSILSEYAHCSPNYLHSLFKKTTGTTPYEYLLEKRITQAKRQIMAGELSLIEIALSCGFCSQSHFNKVFKQHVGMTPAEFRRELWEKY